jgi:5-hydroxyisourate hydrolase
MNQITTHVLDVSLGRPAANVPVILEVQGQGGNSWSEIGRGTTDSDGRPRDLSSSHKLQEATYRLTFNTLAYFASRNIEGLYPQVIIVFHVKNPNEHYHIPLLLSPYGYSTYRGS